MKYRINEQWLPRHHGFAKHDHEFHEGQKVKTRGDIGGFNLVIVKIHNENYCTVKGYGKERHMNMAFIEPNPCGLRY